MSASYVANTAPADSYHPRIALHQFDPSRPCSAYNTERLVDIWHALRRSAVDAALVPAPDRNIFAFQDSCLYFATVHDLDFAAKEWARRERERREKESGEEEMLTMTELLRKQREEFKKRWQYPVPLVGPRVNSGSVHASNANVPSEQDYDTNGLLGHADQELSSSSINNLAGLTDTAWGYDNSAADGFASTMELGSVEETTLQAVSHKFTPCPMSTDAPSTLVTYDAPPALPEATVSSQYIDTCPNSTSSMLESDLIGIAYLAPAPESASSACEVSLGLALLPHARGQGFGTETARRLLMLAFDDLAFHRVSAGVLGPSLGSRPSATSETRAKSKESEKNAELEERLRMSGTEAESEAALRMFVALGFTLEGTRRRAVPESGDNGAWRDAHCLAMLDTEWLALQRRELVSSILKDGQRKGKGRSSEEASTNCEDKASGKNRSTVERRTRWDEMLARHQREQEALARAESRLKRSASSETLRPSIEVYINMAADSGTSVSASTAASDAGVEAPVERAASFSSSASNPFLDSVRLNPGTRFHRFSDEESEESEMEYGEETAHSKVARYLRAHPQPGPPPSELGSVSDFESCADELDLLAPPKGEEAEPLLDAENSADSSSALNLDEGQARKKRRLLDGLGGTGLDATIISPMPNSGSGSGAGVGSISVRPLELRRPAGPRSNTCTKFSDTDLESDSDAETVSTSTWDVLSGGARSPSPSPSLSSGTGSLSLQSVSSSDGE